MPNGSVTRPITAGAYRGIDKIQIFFFALEENFARPTNVSFSTHV